MIKTKAHKPKYLTNMYLQFKKNEINSNNIKINNKLKFNYH